jgi:hypothetical protein
LACPQALNLTDASTSASSTSTGTSTGAAASAMGTASESSGAEKVMSMSTLMLGGVIILALTLGRSFDVL